MSKGFLLSAKCISGQQPLSQLEGLNTQSEFHSIVSKCH